MATDKIIEEAQNLLVGGHCLPDQAVEFRTKLAGLYSFYSTIYQEIQSRKPKTWLKLRENCKSDTQADRQYEMTEDGVNEIGLKLKIKVVEKLMSAFKTIIDVANNERNNSNY